MGRLKTKSKRALKAKRSPLYHPFSSGPSMREISAHVSIWRNRGGPVSMDTNRSEAFTASMCVGKGRTKKSPSYCGWGRGKNPRAAVAAAARDYARVAEGRSGAFAGLRGARRTRHRR